jgi:hypothetical protein
MHFRTALSIKRIVAKRIILKLGPFKSFISQPLCNANLLGPEGCEMKDLNGSSFYSS